MKEVKTKICSKCGKEKSFSEFYRDRSKKTGRRNMCKECESVKQKRYYIKKKPEILKKKREYYKINKPTISKRVHKFRQENRERINKQKRKVYQRDRKMLCEQKRLYGRNNKESISKNKKRYSQSEAVYTSYVSKLEPAERVSVSITGKLLVLCAYCGKTFVPTNQATQDRIKALAAVTRGEQRFYCSENCKQACPIYRQVKYPKGFKKATSREVVPLLRQLVLERDNYICQKCGVGTEISQLHVHHILSYKLNKMVANDPDNCITLCKKCHKEVHSQDGCRYSDLKCPKE